MQNEESTLRLTVDQIRKDIEKTGMTLKSHCWFDDSDGDDPGPYQCGCPMAIHYAANENLPHDELDANNAERFVDLKFGKSYTSGFTRGFDFPADNVCLNSFSDRYRTGQRDGIEARKSLLWDTPSK